MRKLAVIHYRKQGQVTAGEGCKKQDLPQHPSSWCSKADTECNENLRCGEEMVADDERRKKTLFTDRLLRALDRVAFNG
jgi:hypothetical protein